MLEQQRSLGRFRLTDALGSDAVGEVYRAEMIGTLDFARHVAVKLLHPRYAQDPENFAALLRESERVARLQSQHVITVFEAGRRRGVAYLAVEHVEGWNLAQLIEHCRTLGRRFPMGAAAYVVLKLTSAVRDLQAHEDILVHGGIIPEQVFVTRDGQIKLGDCCSAHLILRAAATPHELPLAALPYLAPEQLDREPPGPASDVYALGLILFEMLTGCRFNSGATEELLLQMVARPPEIVPSTIVDDAAALDDAVRCALQRAAAARSSVQGLAARLTAFLQHREFDAGAMAELGAAIEHLRARRALAEAVQSESPLPVTIAPSRRRQTNPYERSETSLPRRIAGSGLSRLTLADAPVASSRADAAISPVLSTDAISVTERVNRLPFNAGENPIADSDDALERQVFGRELARWALAGGVGLLVVLLVVTTVIVLGQPATPRTKQAGPLARRALSPVPMEQVRPRIKTQVTSSSAGTEAQVMTRLTEATREHSAEHSNEGQGDSADSPDLEKIEKGSPTGLRPTTPSVDIALRESTSSQLHVQTFQQKEVAQLIKQARERGLWPGDDSLFDHYCRLAQRDRSSDGAAASTQALENLRVFVEDFQLDPVFIDRKLERLRKLVERTHGERAEQLNQAYLDIAQLVREQALVEASQRASMILSGWGKR